MVITDKVRRRYVIGFGIAILLSSLVIACLYDGRQWPYHGAIDPRRHRSNAEKNMQIDEVNKLIPKRFNYEFRGAGFNNLPEVQKLIGASVTEHSNLFRVAFGPFESPEEIGYTTSVIRNDFEVPDEILSQTGIQFYFLQTNLHTPIDGPMAHVWHDSMVMVVKDGRVVAVGFDTEVAY